MGTVKSNFNSTLCQDPGLCFRRQRLTDDWEQIITGKKRSLLPQCIYSKFFASLFTFPGIILILSFHISCLSFICPPFPFPPSLCPRPPPPPPPPPPPSLLHQGSCGLSETQMNEGPRRASPALPHITYSLSLSITQTGPASLCPMQALPPGCHGNQPSSFFFSFASDAWLCRARVGWMEPWVGAATLQLMPGQAATWTLTPHSPLHTIFHFFFFKRLSFHSWCFVHIHAPLT